MKRLGKTAWSFASTRLGIPGSARSDPQGEAYSEAAAAGDFVKTQVSGVNRGRSVFEAAGGRVPDGTHVEHTIDRELGGDDAFMNLKVLDADLSAQVLTLTADLPDGTMFLKAAIC